VSLTGVMSAAVSGLRAESLRVNVSANNIANVNTEGFKPQDVASQTLATQQVSNNSYSSGGVLATVSPTSIEDQGTDLSFEFTKLIQAESSYRHNIETLKTADDMLKELVNIKA